MEKEKTITDANERFMVNFYLKNKSYMYHIARKFTESQSECEDAIQDAMIRLLRNADSLRQLSANQVDMYLFLTIRSVFADRERKAQEHMHPMPDTTLEILHAQHESGFEDDGLNAMWDTAILKEQLPAKEWRLLELKYIAGYSDQEIAKEIHCVPDSVRTLLRRARKRAKAILSIKKTYESEG